MSAERSGSPILIAIHLWLTAFLAGIIYFYFHYRPDSARMVFPAAVLTSLLSAWWVVSWRKRSGRFFDTYFLFLLAAIAFNGGQVLLEALGLNRDGMLGGYFGAATLCESILLVSLSLHFLHLGALLGVPRRARPHESFISEASLAAALRRIGAVLWVLAAGPTVLVLRHSLAIVRSGGYFGLYQQNAGVGIQAVPFVLSLFMIPASLFLLAGSKQHPKLRCLAILSLIAISFIHLAMGERGTGAAPLVALAFVRHHCIRRFRNLHLVAAASVFAFVVFPLLAVVRNKKLGERADPAALARTLTSMDNPAVAQISEMGATLLTVSYTLELVPSARRFDWGRSYGYAFFTLMPNLFWDLHPSKARGQLGDWLVQTVDSWNAERGGGFGYSFIAEAYANFGWLGVPWFMLALGFFLSFISGRGLASGDPAKIAALGAFLSFFLMFARGESMGIVRPLVWYALIPYLLIPLFRRRGINQT